MLEKGAPRFRAARGEEKRRAAGKEEETGTRRIGKSTAVLSQSLPEMSLRN
jgi:hypothetical protein